MYAFNFVQFFVGGHFSKQKRFALFLEAASRVIDATSVSADISIKKRDFCAYSQRKVSKGIITSFLFIPASDSH